MSTSSGASLPAGGIYRRATPRGVGFWSLEVVGDMVHTASGANLSKLRRSSRQFAAPADAQRHAEKTRLKKLRDGFLFERALDDAEPGDVVLRAARPHGHPHDFFDVHPSGRRLLIGSEKRPTNDDAWLQLVDLDTLQITELLQASSLDRRRSQVFVHAALFLGADSALVALDDVTHRVSLADGQVEQAAAYREFQTSRFNPHCVWPSRDARGERALVFDAGDTIRVIDTEGATVFATSLASLTAECRAGAISPDGKRVAVYIASRHLIYGDQAAATDQTCEVRVFEVDSSTCVATVPLAFQAHRVGLDPSGQTLVVLRHYRQGPAFYDLASGAQTAAFDRDAYHTSRWQTCQTWAYSPDGTQLAVAGHDVRLLDARDHTPLLELESSSARRNVHRLVFSHDGRVLYGGDPSGEVVGWRVR